MPSAEGRLQLFNREEEKRRKNEWGGGIGEKLLVCRQIFCLDGVKQGGWRACVQASEAFLQRMVALYASSHYKNTPNDLILMSDAPAHHLFALLGPVDQTQVSCRDCLHWSLQRHCVVAGGQLQLSHFVLILWFACCWRVVQDTQSS